jgi:hypothetical protein
VLIVVRLLVVLYILLSLLLLEEEEYAVEEEEEDEEEATNPNPTGSEIIPVPSKAIDDMVAQRATTMVVANVYYICIEYSKV